MSPERGGAMIRVTELLRWSGEAEPIPDYPHVRKAMERGTAVHDMSLNLEDRLDLQPDKPVEDYINELPEWIRGYANAVRRFNEDYRPRWIEKELRKVDIELGISGCPDRICVIDEKVSLIDYKTGNNYPWHRLQLALYQILVERAGIQIEQRVNVYLYSSGRYRVGIHNNIKDIHDAWLIINKYKRYKENKPKTLGEGRKP
jgi:CRISPR/Cas system-associated exonuclease Cas4 (RecB family)